MEAEIGARFTRLSHEHFKIRVIQRSVAAPTEILQERTSFVRANLFFASSCLAVLRSQVLYCVTRYCTALPEIVLRYQKLYCVTWCSMYAFSLSSIPSQVNSKGTNGDTYEWEKDFEHPIEDGQTGEVAVAAVVAAVTVVVCLKPQKHVTLLPVML